MTTGCPLLAGGLVRADVVVVGAGAAGLTAAARLTDAGADVVVLEADDRIGGRIHTVELGPGWRYDVGAHAFGSDASSLLALCDGLGVGEIDPWRWDTPDLFIDGVRYRSPFAEAGELPAPPIPEAWTERFDDWVKGPEGGSEAYRPQPDDSDARSQLEPLISALATDCLEASVGHATGWPFADLSASYVRSLFQEDPSPRALFVEEGMIAPFRRLADRLDVRTGAEVTHVEPGLVEPFGKADAVVVAVPAPIAARLVTRGTSSRPDWIDDVAYASEVSAHLFRKSRWRRSPT